MGILIDSWVFSVTINEVIYRIVISSTRPLSEAFMEISVGYARVQEFMLIYHALFLGLHEMNWSTKSRHSEKHALSALSASHNPIRNMGHGNTAACIKYQMSCFAREVLIASGTIRKWAAGLMYVKDGEKRNRAWREERIGSGISGIKAHKEKCRLRTQKGIPSTLEMNPHDSWQLFGEAKWCIHTLNGFVAYPSEIIWQRLAYILNWYNTS